MVDSIANKMKEDVHKDVLMDTVGLSTAPVQIIKASIVNKEYSSYRDVRLTYKNTSGKKIDAISFSWYGEDAFGKPADLGNYAAEGYGGGWVDIPLGIGSQRTNEWSVSSNRAKKITLAWPSEVVFSDGSKWKIGSQTEKGQNDD